MKDTTRKIVITALFSALTCVATLIIRIPSPLGGYLNVGDALVIFSGGMLSPLFAFLAGGLGSLLADVISGYMIYAPVTFLIKGAMALTVSVGGVLLKKKMKAPVSQICLGALAEVIMVFGYYVFEGFLYGFIPAAVNIIPNAIQGAVGLVFGTLLVGALAKTKVRLK